MRRHLAVEVIVGIAVVAILVTSGLLTLRAKEQCDSVGGQLTRGVIWWNCSAPVKGSE